MAGCSENISEGAQRAAGFVSKFASGEWDRLYDGSELQEQRTIFGRYRTSAAGAGIAPRGYANRGPGLASRGYANRGGYGGRYYGGGYGGGWSYYGGGFAAGAILGGLLAAPYYDGYGYDGYGDVDAYAYEAPVDDSAVAYCVQRFRSYDPASGTYLGNDGYRHPCP